MIEVKDRVLEVIQSRHGQPVSVVDVAAELLLPPDVVFRAVAILLQDGQVQVVPDTIEKELQVASEAI